MKKKILIFGNTLVIQDSLAINLMPKLQKQFPEFDFFHLDPTENLEEYGTDLRIIDAVQGIKNPIIITNPDKLKTEKITSMHDFDLAYNLKLLMQTGKIKSVRILGLPLEMNENKAFDYSQSILRKWVAQDIQGS